MEYFRYDASGNIWYDKHNKVVYKNSELGQPVKITTFTSMPSNITLEDVNKEKDFANVESVVDVAYDEAGNRLWYSVDNRVRNEKWTEVTLPGIGVFKSENADAANPTYELVRQDLVAGAYRDASGNVHFPVLDAQGSVRGYVTKSGLESAYDYYPYGTVVEVSPNGGDDNRRWQDKEFDNEHHKYYFGSRYFDPFFGMWMSPDPAGQFANPYSYGGDPVNFVDPNGEEAISTGVVVTAAVVGAIIGGATSAYQCSKYGAGSCSVAVTQGITVGAASGAAGGAAGFAAGGGGAIASGIAGGAAGSATSYVGNGLYTGDMSFGEGFRQTMIGAVAGSIGGGISGAFGSAGWNLLGNTGAEIAGGSIASGVGSVLQNEDFGSFWDGWVNGVLLGLSSSMLAGYLDSYLNADELYDGTDLTKAKLQGGDVIGFGVDVNGRTLLARLKNWLISRGIMTASGEPYSHIAVVDEVNGELGIRESNGEGSNVGTKMSKIKSDPNHAYKNRPFKILGNRTVNSAVTKNLPNTYNLFDRSCVIQVTRWTNSPFYNNPGVFSRYMTGQSHYYHSTSLQRYVW